MFLQLLQNHFQLIFKRNEIGTYFLLHVDKGGKGIEHVRKEFTVFDVFICQLDYLNMKFIPIVLLLDLDVPGTGSDQYNCVYVVLLLRYFGVALYNQLVIILRKEVV